MKKIIWPALALVFFANNPLTAAVDVPSALKPWVPWVMYGHEEQNCPISCRDAGDHRCVWPSDLDLVLDSKGGRFNMNVQVYSDSWIHLPGGTGIWPLDVWVDDRSEQVTLHENRPSIFLAPGDYTIKGDFRWETIPDSLALPPDAGVVSLALNGKEVVFPDIRNERLWLKGRGEEKAAEEDRLEILVYRRIIDDVPLQVVTRLDIDIAGRQREEILGPVLISSENGGLFLPIKVASRLPSRLEDDGTLHLQARPGHWVVEIHTRSTGNIQSLSVPELQKPWPKEEIWVFEPRNALRLVEPGGLPPVDPRQTTLPQEWQELPAFIGRPGETMDLKVIRRGDVDPVPDNLAITRDLWLDFDGTGYTVRDRISGVMSRSHRLEAAEGLLLGRVSVNGESRLITGREGSTLRGIEVRRGRIEAQAESRVMAPVNRIPVTGWNHDFQNVSADLKVPPGWDVFAAFGADNRPWTWLQRWTLLDVFMVLVVSVAVFRLYTPLAGGLALLALVLSWHAPYAPRYIWVHLLIASALVRYLPEGRLFSWARGYRVASLVILGFLVVPFTIDQVRTAFFPQLEHSGIIQVPSLGPAAMKSGTVIVPQVQYEQEQEEDAAVMGHTLTEAAPQEAGVSDFENRSKSWYLDSLAQRYDQTANVQTGPGLPDWQWKSIRLNFNGPVKAGQGLRIIYITPSVNTLARLMRVLFVSLLGLLFLGVRIPGRHVLSGVMVIFLVLGISPAVQADQFPDQAVLEELQKRLLKPPECVPDCAQASRMLIDANEETMNLRLEIHTLDKVAVPLPGTASQWLPETVYVNGNTRGILQRDRDGSLWISLEKGIHQLVLEGRLPRRSTVQIPLGLSVRKVDANISGWALDGVHENGVPEAQLQLTRLSKENDEVEHLFETGSLPPFVTVERNLVLGLEWRTRTVVRRVSPAGSAVVLEVPLLPSESVITDGIRVAEGKVQVNLGARQQILSWESALDQVPEITLRAPDQTEWIEVWRAEISPVWNLEQAGGITVIHRQDPEGVWIPEWRPWPGEQVHLLITRPNAIAGSTLTVDSSLLVVKPGKRATDNTFSFRARSSLGGQHVISLPEGAELSSVKVDGKLQPVRLEENFLSLPVHPGKQSYEIGWRATGGIRDLFLSPHVNLGIESVNHGIQMRLPSDRWILFTGGPRLGPAVLFWWSLVVVVLVSIGLGKTALTPLGWWQWILLGIGLTQASLLGAFIIVFWLVALGLRRRLTAKTDAKWFNMAQVGLIFLTLAAAVSLFGAVEKGLLGFPSMQVMGNGSYGTQLQWYADRMGPESVHAWALSAPLFVYRILMLAWALWLAWALIGWIRWGWESVSFGGYWRQTNGLIKNPWKRKKRDQWIIEENEEDPDSTENG